MNIEQARFNMIEQQIRPWEVLDQDVLNLLSIVKREHFVPAAFREMAFVDFEVPLPAGQHMLAPRVEARVLQELAVKKHESVLKIGGRLAAFVGTAPVMKAQIITRIDEKQYRIADVFETYVEPLINAVQPPRFKF